MNILTQTPTDEMVYKHFISEGGKKSRGAQARTARFFGKSDTWVGNKCRDFERMTEKVQPRALLYTPPPGALELLRQMPTVMPTAKPLRQADDNATPIPVMSSNDDNAASQSPVGIQLPRTEIRYSQQFLVHQTHHCRFNHDKHFLWTIPTCPVCTESFGLVVIMLLCGLGLWLLFLATTAHVFHSPYPSLILLVLSTLWLRDSGRATAAWLDLQFQHWRWWTGGIALTSCTVAGLMLYLKLS